MDSEDINIDTFRFFIRDEQDNKKSSTWYVWHTADNVYLCVNSLGGRMKASFHPQGQALDGKDSQFGFQKAYRDKLHAESYNPPKPSRWIRPRPEGTKIVQVAKVLFPTAHLRGVMPDERADYEQKPGIKRKWRFSLPMAGEGEAVEVSLFYSLRKIQDTEDSFIQKGFTPFFGMELPGGENVSVVARKVVFDRKSLPPAGNYAGGQKLDGFKDITGTETNLSATLSNDPKDGEILQLIEMNGIGFQPKTAPL